MRPFSTAAFVAALLGLADAIPQATRTIATKVCHPTMRASPDPHAICGVEGSLEKASLLEKHTRVNPDEDFFVICRNACWKMDTCLAFSFDRKSTLCELFEKPLNAMGFTPSKDGIVHYGRPCFEEVCETRTTTIAATATPTPGYDGPAMRIPEIFVLQVSGTGTVDDGSFVQLAKDWADEGYMAHFRPGGSSATRFTLDDEGTLVTVAGQYMSNINPGSRDTYFFFNAIERIALHGYTKITCKVSTDGLYTLTCSSLGNFILEDCSGDLFITGSLNPRCTNMTLTVIEAMPEMAKPTSDDGKQNGKPTTKENKRR